MTTAMVILAIGSAVLAVFAAAVLVVGVADWIAGRLR
jgi:hypothetical protein